MDYVTNITKIGAACIKRLAHAASQAYNAFDPNHSSKCHRARITPPDGFEFVDFWTGVDSVFGCDKTVEVYGLVFRSLAAPWRYIFSFRGTACVLDALDDLGVETTILEPFDTDTAIPGDVHVESGFNSIYRTSAGSTESMQRQLFGLIDKYQASERPIAELNITGHSLGAALSQLFTLDVALSRPSVAAININFASPRVGNHSFVRFYQQAVTGPDGFRSLRVQNMYDAVPDVPPTELGFAHVPFAYVIAFYRDNWYGKLDLADCHSILNYGAVVECGAASTNGVCVAHRMHVPGQGYTIRSERPTCSSTRARRETASFFSTNSR